MSGERESDRDDLEFGMDLDLREVLGGEQAPDLVEAVLRRHTAAPATTTPKTGRWRRPLLAACLVLGVGAVAATAWNLTVGGGEALEDPNAAGPTDQGDPLVPDPGPPSPRDPDSGSIQDPARSIVERLENGVTVLVWRVPGTGMVGMETSYTVGFLHEPAGMTQAAHLLEHVVCNGATAGHDAGASFAQLQEVGMANAETMPTFTHYDFVLPADQLELGLAIEAERLTSLRIDRAMLRQEAPRCYQETDFVERNPATGMIKHAFMAIHQGWRHDRDDALVRGGLGEMDLDGLRAFHRRTYRPSNLTVAIVGDVDPKAALELVRKHLGAIEEPAAPHIERIDWSAVAPHKEIRWDSSRRAVALCWAPPRDPVDRVILTLIGSQVRSSLSQDPSLSLLADHVSVSNWTWPVGELPFYVYATAADGVALEDLEEAMTAAVRKAMATVQIMPGQLAIQAKGLHDRVVQLTPGYVDAVSRNLAQRGRTPQQALGMVLGQGALNWITARSALGDAPSVVLEGMQTRPRDSATKLIRSLIDSDPLVTHLVPR